MYLIQILLALLRLANWKRGFRKIKRIETLETGPQYYRITNHYDTLRMIYGVMALEIGYGIINLGPLWPPTAVVAAFLRRGVGVSPSSRQSLSDDMLCSQNP